MLFDWFHALRYDIVVINDFIFDSKVTLFTGVRLANAIYSNWTRCRKIKCCIRSPGRQGKDENPRTLIVAARKYIFFPSVPYKEGKGKDRARKGRVMEKKGKRKEGKKKFFRRAAVSALMSRAFLGVLAINVLGITVAVNNHLSYPLLGNSIDINVDTATNISISRVFINKLPKPYSECDFDLDDAATSETIPQSELYKLTQASNFTYRQIDCFCMCYQRFLLLRPCLPESHGAHAARPQTVCLDWAERLSFWGISRVQGEFQVISIIYLSTYIKYRWIII